MSDYMPGAVQVPQKGGVTLDTSLPARFVWHITWDKLDANGHQPAFSAVANYLQGMQYCPHIMWNPFTGYMEQYYPANVGSRALAYNDQDGAACIQVEVFFTPGCVVDGITYQTVADTPLKGFADLLAWGDSLGVPRAWPMGAPQWQGNPRDVGIWNGQAGHYGHCHSPGDTHTDPGPMPSLTGSGSISVQSASITPLTPVQEDALSAEEVVQIQGFINDAANTVMAENTAQVTAAKNELKKWVIDQITAAKETTILDNRAQIGTVPAAVLGFNYRPSANLAGALDAIHAQPSVTNVTAAAVDVDALVARLTNELPAAVLAQLATQLTKP